MSASPAAADREHRAIRELLPFFVNDTLSEIESARVARHAAGCAGCRQEIDEQRGLAPQFRGAPDLAGDPQAAWQRLERRLEKERQSSNASTLDRLLPPARPLRIALAATVTIALLIPIARYWNDRHWSDDPVEYRTLTSASGVSDVPDGAIRTVFAPRATLREIEELLERTQYQIVSGPSPRGVYTLAPTARGAASRDATLAALHASPLVALAEPITQPTATDAGRR